MREVRSMKNKRECKKWYMDKQGWLACAQKYRED